MPFATGSRMQNCLEDSGSFQPEQKAQGPASVELSELKGILLHRRVMILGTAAVLTILTLIYGLLTPALFSSTAQIIIDPRDRQVVSNDVNPSSISPDGGITQVESQVMVAQSTGVLLRAIKATNLTDDSEFSKEGLLSRLLALFGASPAPDSKTVKTIDALRKSLSVKRADKVLVLDVTVTARSAQKAALLANAIASAYLEDQSEARSQAARQASDGLMSRLAEQRRQVEKAENAVERYKNENNMVMASGRLVSEQVLTDLNSQLTVAQNRTSTLRAQVDQIRRQREGGASSDATAEVMQSVVISKLREQEATLGERASDMESQLGPRHPSIVSIRSQQRGLRTLIDRELNRIAVSANTEYERALANEQALATRKAALEKASLSSDQASVRLRELQRDLEAVRSIYANYLTRSQETREQIGIDSTNARIISQAMPAQKKKWPPLPLLLAGAIFGGLGLGAGLALIAEYTSPTALSATQVKNATGATILGILPTETRKKTLRERLLSKRTSSDAKSSPVGLIPNFAGTMGLALRRLSDMRKSKHDDRSVPSILLTSRYEDSSERTRVAALLAAAAASRGYRVLLIDANVARSAGTDEPGLLDVLSGDCTLQRSIKVRYGDNVAYMGVGRPKTILNEDKGLVLARAMFVEARNMFELVVIDGGDLTENIKAAALVAAVDDLILVAELKATPLHNIVSTAQAATVMGRSLTAALLVDATVRGSTAKHAA